MVPDLIAGNDRLKIIYRIDHGHIDQSIVGSFEAATWRFLLGPQVFREWTESWLIRFNWETNASSKRHDTGVRSKAWRIDICIFHTSVHVYLANIIEIHWSSAKGTGPAGRRRNLERQSGSGKKGQETITSLRWECLALAARWCRSPILSLLTLADDTGPNPFKLLWSRDMAFCRKPPVWVHFPTEDTPGARRWTRNSFHFSPLFSPCYPTSVYRIQESALSASLIGIPSS